MSPSTGIETEELEHVAAWEREEEFLRSEVPGLLCGRPAVRRIAALAEDVWEIEVEDGRKLVAKQQVFGFLVSGGPLDLLEVEEKVLGILRQDGCPVPRVLGCDRAAQIIYLEHVGDRTLDDVVQEGAGEVPSSYIRQAIVGLQAIDRNFSQHQAELGPLVSEAVGESALQAAWHTARQQAREGLAALHRHLDGETPRRRCDQALEEMGTWLATRSPVLGSSDYNARNLVVDVGCGKLSFIEFAKIGWDWTERRLVQYTTSMGSGREDGCMRRLLDAGGAAFYQEHSGRRDGARALDYHQIFFLLNGVAMLCNALEAPAKAPGARLLSLWKNPQQRLTQFASHLAGRLSADALATEFRAGFRAAIPTPDKTGDIL
ncbi:MAG TPA: hypothetical protein EYM39_02635 [Candidatus Latescibacteria bacterium]|nr:hypothetical protein [Candidatus Latescibacterota bacterium]